MKHHLTIKEIPLGNTFKIQGSDVEFTKLGDQELETKTVITFGHPDIDIIMAMSKDTETQTLRPIFLIDPTTVVASYGNVYLSNTLDGYIMETFDAQGMVHYEEFFQIHNLHRALSKLQSLMPEQIPEWAMCDITRPCGARHYSANTSDQAIRDTFFIGYGESPNSLDLMEEELNSHGWVFNDLRKEQEVCSK